MFAGAIDVPIYPTLTPPQVRYILNDSGACVLFVERREKFLRVESRYSASVPQLSRSSFSSLKVLRAEDGLTLAQLEVVDVNSRSSEPGRDRKAGSTKPGLTNWRQSFTPRAQPANRKA